MAAFISKLKGVLRQGYAALEHLLMHSKNLGATVSVAFDGVVSDSRALKLARIPEALDGPQEGRGTCEVVHYLPRTLLSVRVSAEGVSHVI